MELLGFMEAPGGNVAQIAEVLSNATDTSRNFIDTYVRRGWVVGVRVDVKRPPNLPQEPCSIW